MSLFDPDDSRYRSKEPRSWRGRYFKNFTAEKRLNESGDGFTRVYIYHGDWGNYDIEKSAQRRYGAIFLVLAVLSAGLFILASTYPSKGNAEEWLLGPTMVSMVSWLYLVMGLVQFTIAKKDIPVMDHDSIHKKVYFGSLVSAALLLYGAIATLIYALVKKESGFNYLLALGYLAAAAMDAAIFFLYRRIPRVVTESDVKKAEKQAEREEEERLAEERYQQKLRLLRERDRRIEEKLEAGAKTAEAEAKPGEEEPGPAEDADE